MLFETLSFMMKGIFLMKSLNVLSAKKMQTHIKMINALFICCLVYSRFDAVKNPRNYILDSAAETFLLILYVIYFIKRYNEDVSYMRAAYTVCCAQIVHEIISMVSIVSGTMACWLLGFSLDDELMPFCLFCKMIIIIIFFRCNLNMVYSCRLSVNYQWTIIFLYLLITLAKMPFYFTDINDVKSFKVVIITMLVSLAGFLTAAGYDKHKTNQEKERMEADNRRLSAQLHKSKEILPAMVSVLEQVAGEKKIKSRQRACELLNEVHDLYGCQLKENQMDDLFLKSFGSTGLQLLDAQLMEYLVEAEGLKINLDIFIPEPINLFLKKKKINQLKFQRAVGDMIRNAFRAVERANIDEGEILVIIGCKEEGTLEISVMDNGTAFPEKVLNNFGKRGISEGGTGNGLADLAEFAREEAASLILEEAKEKETFTKTLSLLFDGKNRLEIQRTGRDEL